MTLAAPSVPAPYRDRLSYLWLVLAAALFLLAYGRWTVPLAAWFAPLFLLRFVRTQRPLTGFILAWIARAAAAAVGERGIILEPAAVYVALILAVTLVSTLPYLLDRLAAPRLPAVLRTLAFPASFAAVEYLLSFGLIGTFSSIANSQYGDLPLMQLASVTGLWGITFLIAWFAATVNSAWEQGAAWPAVRRELAVYAGVVALVLLAGGMRLAFSPSSPATVRIAGISASQADSAAQHAQLPASTLDALESGRATDADRTAARSAFATLDAGMLARTRQEAQAGARIVVWPESSPDGANVLQEDEAALIGQAAALARQEGIYLDMGLGVFLQNAAGPQLRDESVLLDPNGNVAWRYEKTHLAPGEQGLIVPGNGRVPVIDSSFGRLAGVICFDLDYPAQIRQAGLANAGILLAPSDDWREVDPIHSQAAVYRAIENGVSLVRPVSKGLSIATDDEGRVLAAADYFTTDQQVMVAYVPERGVRTVYSVIGDAFAWLCLLALPALIALAVVRGRKRAARGQAVP